MFLALEADTAAYSAHLQKARELSLRAAESAQQEQEKEVAATYRATSALREALFGNVAVARQQAPDVRTDSLGRDLGFAVALAFSYVADAKRAQTLAERLNKQFPQDTVVQFNYLPLCVASSRFFTQAPETQFIPSTSQFPTNSDSRP